MSLLVKMVSSYPRAIKKSMKFVRQILTAVYDIFSVYDPGIQMSLTCQKNQTDCVVQKHSRNPDC